MSKMMEAILAMLREHEREYRDADDVYREKAYHMAGRTIAAMPRHMTREELLRELDAGIPTIGKSIDKKIRAVIAQLGHSDDAQPTFAIMGASAATISKWNVKSIAELRRAVAEGRVKLTHEQALGLKFHADLVKRVPRAEVAEIAAKFAEIADMLGVSCIVCGSYRRGLAESGDVDLVFSPSPPLETRGLIAALGIVANIGTQRMKMLVRHRGIVRQVDIIFADREELGAAVLYFTGSMAFNVKMRTAAKMLGMRLNQHGLYDKRGALVSSGFTEREYFAALDMQYVEPSRRS